MTDTSERPAAIYRGMDKVALDAAYNNSAAVADSSAILGHNHFTILEELASPDGALTHHVLELIGGS